AVHSSPPERARSELELEFPCYSTTRSVASHWASLYRQEHRDFSPCTGSGGRPWVMRPSASWPNTDPAFWTWGPVIAITRTTSCLRGYGASSPLAPTWSCPFLLPIWIAPSVSCVSGV